MARYDHVKFTSAGTGFEKKKIKQPSKTYTFFKELFVFGWFCVKMYLIYFVLDFIGFFEAVFG